MLEFKFQLLSRTEWF